MSNLIDRLSQVVKAEWSHRTGEKGDRPRRSSAAVDAHVPAGGQDAPRRVDVESAWRILELEPGRNLDEVRAAYRTLAVRYHPKTKSGSQDQMNAAHTLLEALTEALEVLEEHLLPLPPGSAGPR